MMRLGEEHILHHDELCENANGQSRIARLDWHRQHKTLSIFPTGRFHHLRGSFRWFAAGRPLLAEFSASRLSPLITRQQVGIQAHISRTSRIGIVAQTDELAPEFRRRISPARQSPHPNLRSENDNQILLATKLISKPAAVVWFACAVAGDPPAVPSQPSRRIIPSECSKLPLSPRRNLQKPSRLPVSFISASSPHTAWPDAAARYFGSGTPANGCWLRRSFPISRIAGALDTSRMVAVASGFQTSPPRKQGSRQSMMINVVGLQNHPRELLQQVFSSLVVRLDPNTPIAWPPCCSELL